MTNRRKSRIATIECAAELVTLNRIAECSGLVVERTEAPDQFHILNSGRNVASELKTGLWRDMTVRLDDAVTSGAIPGWRTI